MGTWCDLVGPECDYGTVASANSQCEDRVSDRWTFNEGAYCLECPYRFYVLVGCGRGIHLPFADMEGARVRVRDVLDGRPVTLRCANDAARGSLPIVKECFAPDKIGYGPAFDLTTVDAPLEWGLPDCTASTDLGCDQVPEPSGVIPVSPGEQQLMDCTFSVPGDPCGIFEVEIISGGHEWTLYANCDGSSVRRRLLRPHSLSFGGAG